MSPSALKFVLPTALAVTTFALANACTPAPDDGDTSSHGDNTDDDFFYCGDIGDMSECADETQCAWSDDYGECVHACTVIDNHTECEAIEGCSWETEGEGTGETSFCLEPFT